MDSQWAPKGGRTSKGVGETTEELSALFGANVGDARLKAGLTQVEVTARRPTALAQIRGLCLRHRRRPSLWESSG